MTNSVLHSMQCSNKTAMMMFNCTCPAYFCDVCGPVASVGARTRLCAADLRDLVKHVIPAEDLRVFTSVLRPSATNFCRTSELRTLVINNSHEGWRHIMLGRTHSLEAPVWAWLMGSNEQTYWLIHTVTSSLKADGTITIFLWNKNTVTTTAERMRQEQHCYILEVCVDRLAWWLTQIIGLPCNGVSSMMPLDLSAHTSCCCCWWWCIDDCWNRQHSSMLPLWTVINVRC